MNDLTILYYTANRLPEVVGFRIREHLQRQHLGYRVVSISQKSIRLGYNVCVGDIGANKYNAYWQIWCGLEFVDTEFVATVDDDTLYMPEHFDHRPPPGEFWYETNYWFCQDGKDHYWRPAEIEKRGGMLGCLARTETLRANLEARFAKFPDPSAPLPPWWGEPGDPNGDKQYGRADTLRRVTSARPCVVFIHERSMGYTQFRRWHRRYGQPRPENMADTLPGYGTVADLRREFWGEAQAVAA